MVFLSLVPFLFAGTVEEAVVHVFRILFQQRLSSGFPNPWWLFGHALSTGRDGTSFFGEPVGFAPLDLLPFPASWLALPLFFAAVVWVARCQRSYRGSRAACLAGASMVFAYAIWALGVHENHPHLIFLCLAATGLASIRLRFVTAALSFSYVLNMLALSGIGRFYGSRHQAWTGLAARLAELRMSLGFDLTLVLAVLNTALFAWLMLRLPEEMAEARANE